MKSMPVSFLGSIWTPKSVNPWIRSDSTRVLPAFFNRTFDRREQRARKTLAAIVAARKGEKRLA